MDVSQSSLTWVVCTNICIPSAFDAIGLKLITQDWSPVFFKTLGKPVSNSKCFVVATVTNPSSIVWSPINVPPPTSTSKLLLKFISNTKGIEGSGSGSGSSGGLTGSPGPGSGGSSSSLGIVIIGTKRDTYLSLSIL
jgi:hypothetical protein